MLYKCFICGLEFDSRTPERYCSSDCKAAAISRKHRHSDKYARERLRQYRKHVKASRKRA